MSSSDFAGWRRATTLVCLLAVIAATTHAHAQALVPESTGVEMGFRVGYGLPIGDSARVGGRVEGVVPFTLDLGYRITTYWYVGVLASFGILSLDQASLGCGVAAYPDSCEGTTMRLALDVQYRNTNGGQWARWVGFGLGLEAMGIAMSLSSSVASGFELGHVEVGAGWFARPRFAIGPFATLAVGRFSTSELVSGPCEACPPPYPPDIGKGLHAWLTLGLRMMLNFGR